MLKLLFAYFLRNWVWFAITGALVGALAWAGIKGFNAGRDYVNERIERTVIHMLEERSKVDNEILKMPDSAVRDELRRWVPPSESSTGTTPSKN